MAGKIESVQEHLKDLPKVTTLLSTTKTLWIVRNKTKSTLDIPPPPPYLLSALYLNEENELFVTKSTGDMITL